MMMELVIDLCFVYGIYLWAKHGGRLLIVFHPFPHVLVLSKDIILHGTNKSGKWKIESIEKDSFIRWLMNVK